MGCLSMLQCRNILLITCTIYTTFSKAEYWMCATYTELHSFPFNWTFDTQKCLVKYACFYSLFLVHIALQISKTLAA